MDADYSKIPEGAKVLFKAVVGSRAFGIDTESSDTDIKGVYVQHEDDILGFGKYQDHAIVGKDETYYEIRRFLELMRTGNPMAMELLFGPEDCILVSEPEFDIVIGNRNDFITARCIPAFGHYAMDQFKKAEVHNRHRRTKNMMHCMRLLEMAREIAETGKINVRRPNRDELLSIKTGEMSYEAVKSKADEEMRKILELGKNSRLPKDVPAELCNSILLNVRLKYRIAVDKTV